MFSHEDIWRAIDRLAAGSGYSASGLARKAGLDPTTFNRSKRLSGDGKPRWPSTESIAKILAVTNATVTDFMSLTGTDGDAPAPRKIPIIGCAQAGRAGFFDDAGFPTGSGWDEVSFPTPEGIANDAHIYALEVSGDSMEPLYRDGDILVVSPAAGIRRGDRVVVKTKDGEVMVKELIKKSAAKIDLKSLNARHGAVSLPAKDILWTARVIWVSQ